MDKVQVVVIGAGAAGLATAACLLRRGIRPLVLDRARWSDRRGPNATTACTQQVVMVTD
jgi:phytoene dehydrogenase-like protein